MFDLMTQAEILHSAMLAKGGMVSLAESCTGGMVASTITSISGSSQWFDAGFVTYSNHAKTSMLGVSADTIQQYGAVSEQTALEMAQGVLANSQANIAGSITGIAGPTGGTEQKPVGTVYMAWANDAGDSEVARYQFSGDRDAVRRQASLAMMNGLLQIITGADAV